MFSPYPLHSGLTLCGSVSGASFPENSSAVGPTAQEPIDLVSVDVASPTNDGFSREFPLRTGSMLLREKGLKSVGVEMVKLMLGEIEVGRGCGSGHGVAEN